MIENISNIFLGILGLNMAIVGIVVIVVPIVSIHSCGPIAHIFWYLFSQEISFALRKLTP
jgi:hypothetical protein